MADPAREVRIHVQGSGPIGDLIVQEQPSSCGDITDGVSIRFEHPVPADYEETTGLPARTYGFVISWADFENAYKRMRNIRDSKPYR